MSCALFRAVFKAFASPLGLSLGLLVAGLFSAKRPRIRAALLAASVAALILFSTPVVSNAVIASLERQYPDTGTDAVPPQDAIVLLGGYLRLPADGGREPDLNDAGDRLLRAVDLYRAGKAPLLVASGGSSGPVPECIAAKRLLLKFGVPDRAILPETKSRNTQENAVFTRALLAPRRLHRIALVTSAAHMPRAVAVFRRAGFTVFPVPTDFRSGALTPGDPTRWLADPNALSDSTSAIREWAGILVYSRVGWM